MLSQCYHNIIIYNDKRHLIHVKQGLIIRSMVCLIDTSAAVLINKSMVRLIDTSVVVLIDKSMVGLINRSAAFLIDKSMVCLIKRSVAVLIDRNRPLAGLFDGSIRFCKLTTYGRPI